MGKKDEKEVLREVTTSMIFDHLMYEDLNPLSEKSWGKCR